MIPKNITKDHILAAIQKVDSQGIPAGRFSRKYILFYKGKDYPPKYVISLANLIANGRELDHSGRCSSVSCHQRGIFR